MASIYADPDVNPAVALYESWIHTVESCDWTPPQRPGTLHDNRWSSYASRYGVGGGERMVVQSDEMGPDGRPIFLLSEMLGSRSRSYNNPLMLLAGDGSFCFGHYLRSRDYDLLAKTTFLGWGWAASRRQWFVDARHTTGDYYETRERLRNERVPYLVSTLFNSRRRWKLEKQSEWTIRPAESMYVAQQRIDVERYDEIRTRRQELEARRRDEIDSGRLPQRRDFNVRLNDEKLSRDDAALAIAAVLDVSMPAKRAPAAPRRDVRPVEAVKG